MENGRRALTQFTALLPIIGKYTPLIRVKELARHPDQMFSQYILAKINSGFKVGFNRSCVLKSTESNLCCNNPRNMIEYLRT